MHVLNRLIPALALVAIAFATPACAHAQYAADQDSTLRGVKKVYVNFGITEKALSPEDGAALQSSAILELRKAGIKVVKDTTELDMLQDAILNLSLVRTGTGYSDDCFFRIDVEQRATVVRTKKTTQMVTWFYEDFAKNVALRNFAGPAVQKGVNEFLSHWMDANGR